jgi:hypothetical protein
MPSPFPGMDPYLEGSLEIFTSVYDLLGYDLALDYTQPPEVVLEGKALHFADDLLRAAGKRQV